MMTTGLRTELEPAVATLLGDETLGLVQADRAVALSQAISLRRIADALGTSSSLDDVLQSFAGNLANTFAEHRMYSK